VATDDLVVSKIQVTVVRKAIKNLHIGVYPPDGRVRVAAPEHTPDAVIRAAITSRLGWIRKQQRRFEGQARESRREMVSGESHWFLGRRYRLSVVETPRPWGVRVLRASVLELRCPHGSDAAKRAVILDQWYRTELVRTLSPLVATWSGVLGVTAMDWRVRKMRTKWGSCSAAGRLWFNLELAEKPRRTIQYIVVHELAHLIERRHDAAFQALMDHHLPDWREARRELGALPLGADTWDV
jgi:predicted metal-dependent hydrolase